MNKAGVERLVVLSDVAHFPGFINSIERYILGKPMPDSHQMEEIVQQSGTNISAK